MNRKFTLIITVLLLFAIQFAVASGSLYLATPLTGIAEERLLADVRYRLDAGRSKFMVRAFAGGLLWFKGHDHFIAVQDFDGEIRLTP